MESKNTKIKNTILHDLEDVRVISVQDKIGIDLFHFEITALKSGVKGTGSDPTREIAFLKAQNELVERLVFTYVKDTEKIKNSNGFAAHDSITNAKKSALNELLERDLFLTSWFTGNYPRWDLSKLNLDFEYLETQIEKFKNHNLGLRIGHIGNCGEIQCLTAVIYDLKDRFGGIFAAAADKDCNTALKKILIDMRRMGTFLINSFKSNDLKFSGEFDFLKTTDHLNYYLDKKHKDFFYNFINSSGSSIELSPINEHFNEFILPIELSPNLRVVQCSSVDVQNYFTGVDLAKNINFSRLKEAGSLDLTRKIHPFG